MDFYNYLNYSLGNEDWHVEKQALNITPADRVVCVTASGDRPLHVLMTSCTEVVSIDMNNIQNYLLDLKHKAILHLDYEKYLDFLGCEPCSHRYTIYQEIRPHLHADTAAFWDNHKRMLARGVIYQGRVERLTAVSSRFIQLLRSNKTKALLNFDDLNEQRQFLSTWDTTVWRKIFEICLNPKIFKYVINDPGVNAYAEFPVGPGTYVYDRMLRYLNMHLARKSPLLQLIFTGKILPEAYFPYLTWVGYENIRQSNTALTLKNGDIISYLNKECEKTFDAFSMSDIASYMSQTTFERLLAGIKSSASPGARFCLREFVSKRYIPTIYATHFKRNSSLETKLELEETNFVYRFIAGTIQK